MTKKIALPFLIVLLLNIGCRKMDSVCAQAGEHSQEIGDAFTAAGSAAIAFDQDPSRENCIAYRDAFNHYLDLARKYEPCWIPSQRDELRQGIRDAEEELNELDCN